MVGYLGMPEPFLLISGKNFVKEPFLECRIHGDRNICSLD